MLAKGRQFLSHVLPAVIKPLREIWNQLIGLIFLALALPAIARLIKAVREPGTGEQAAFELVLSGIWATVMIYFGVSSFWRARKISRS